MRPHIWQVSPDKCQFHIGPGFVIVLSCCLSSLIFPPAGSAALYIAITLAKVNVEIIGSKNRPTLSIAEIRDFEQMPFILNALYTYCLLFSMSFIDILEHTETFIFYLLL